MQRKPEFTRSLTCISKYGDEMVIHSDPDSLLLTSISQAKTAFCSFTYERSFFVRYVAPQAVEGNDSRRSRCQLQTKVNKFVHYINKSIYCIIY